MPMLGDRSAQRNRFLLVYGSATGQAQAICEEIAEKAPSFGLIADLHPLEETGKRFNIEHEKCLVVVTSTTGDGDPPANAEKFMRRIRKRTLTSDYLSHLSYALLGLGDTNYSNFCRCAQDLDARFHALGAQRFYPTGLADDGVGLEVVAEPWLEGLYPALQAHLNVQQTTPEPLLTETVDALRISNIKTDQDFSEADVIKDTSEAPVLNGRKEFLSDGNTEVERGEEETKAVTVLANGCVDSESSISEGQAAMSLVPVHNLENRTVTALDKVDAENLLPTCIVKDGCDKFTDVHGDIRQNIGNGGSFDEYRSQETVFSVASVLNELSLLSESLTHPAVSLSERALTIPLLPPDFLHAQFSHDCVETSSMPYQNDCKLPSCASEIFSVPLLSAKVLSHPDALKRTVLLSLDVQNAAVTYSPGDAISVVCPNSTSEVDMLLKRLGVWDKADDCMILSLMENTKKRRAAIPPHLPVKSTLRHSLTSCLNIREPPSKAFIRALIEHTPSAGEQRRMQELCSKEGAGEYMRFVREHHISLLDFLLAFPSCMPSVERVLEHLPRLPPRPYSACSCQQVNANSLDIVFNVVEIPVSVAEGHLYARRGVCTGWLDDITSCLQSSGAGVELSKPEIPIFLRTNQHFRPPDDLSRPIIMIGPGTGVAPFIGFLQQRALKRKQLPKDDQYGETWLFFGCRNKDKDFLFRQELEQFHSEGVLTNLCVAFSRDNSQDATTSSLASPRYVQDLMKQVGSDLSRLVVDMDCLVYVCGDAKNMAKDVTAALEEILQKEKDWTKDEANLALMKKRLHKTYFEDVWL